MQARQTIPILRIFSVEKAKEFYVNFLGFTFEWAHRFDEMSPTYMQVSRDGLVLHLTEHHGDCCPGSAVFVEINGLLAFHQELTGKRYRYMKPGICQEPWGASLTVLDPFGNKLRFNERRAEPDAGQA